MSSQEHEARSTLVDAVRQLEEATALDDAVAAMKHAADALVANPRLREVLRGKELGHAVHPILTDVPIGAWMSAAVLDIAPVEGSAAAARRLVGLGLLSAIPTAVTGLAEWAAADRRAQRVGVVHAALNNVALLLYAISWFSRRRESGSGKISGFLGLGTVMVSGYLGGHLAIGRKVGTSAFH